MNEFFRKHSLAAVAILALITVLVALLVAFAIISPDILKTLIEIL